MTDAGTFSGYTRDDIADVFDVIPRRVAERFERARRAGLLDRVGGGYKASSRSGQPSSPAIHSVRNSAPWRRQSVRVWRTLFPHPINGYLRRTGVRDSTPHDARVTYETRQSIGHRRNAGVPSDHELTREEELREGDKDVVDF
jgi:hypothetical protein